MFGHNGTFMNPSQHAPAMRKPLVSRGGRLMTFIPVPRQGSTRDRRRSVLGKGKASTMLYARLHHRTLGVLILAATLVLGLFYFREQLSEMRTAAIVRQQERAHRPMYLRVRSNEAYQQLDESDFIPQPIMNVKHDNVLSGHRRHHRKVAHRHPTTAPSPRARPEFMFQNTADELGVLVNFLGALASNALPNSLDPRVPLNPDVVLEFDVRRGEDGVERVTKTVQDAWTRWPVVVFIEQKGARAKASHELLRLVKGYRLTPQPLVIDLAERSDARVLRSVLQRLTGAETLPLVIIGGSPIIDSSVFGSLHQSGTIKKMFLEAGSVPYEPEDLA